jgi:hypothetical protein
MLVVRRGAKKFLVITLTVDGSRASFFVIWALSFAMPFPVADFLEAVYLLSAILWNLLKIM